MSTDVGAATAPRIDPDARFERLWLDERSWVDLARGWLVGRDEVFAAVRDRTAWRDSHVFRYDRWLEEARQGAAGALGERAPHPVLNDAHRALQRRYRVTFPPFSLGRYRHGRDGQAFHRDRDLRWLDDTIIAILTLGSQRPWMLRPRANRWAHDLDHHGATHDLSPAGGDLLVMGGACQVGWEHSVAKVSRSVGERISVQWRWTSRTGRPVEGPSYRAPRHYSR